MARYRGIGWPWRVSSDGVFPPVVEDDILIAQSIRLLIDTGVGERVMRPGEGSRTWQTTFEATGPIERARLAQSLRRTIEEGEPRVEVITVTVDADGNILRTRVRYRIKGESSNREVER